MKLNQQRYRIENRGFFIVTRKVNNTFCLITDIKDEHSGVRIFCRTSEEDEREWNEVTEQLENIAVLENGTVTFTVNHFSE